MARSATPKPAAKAPATPQAPQAPRKSAAVKAAQVVPVVPVAPKVEKPKAKLVRDSFTMPAADFALIAALKARALVFQRPAKKSELLRAGLQVLQALDDGKLRKALDALEPLKIGRPKKGA